MKQTKYDIPVFEDEDIVDLKDYSEKMAEAIKAQVDKFGNPLTFKGIVSNFEELKDITDATNGDIYTVEEESKSYIWNGTTWIIYSEASNLKSLENRVDEIERRTLPTRRNNRTSISKSEFE